MHKAAHWGHDHIVSYLLDELKLSTSVQDSAGDTPLHDAIRYGHTATVELLLAAGASTSVKNNLGQDAAGIAAAFEKSALFSKL